MKTSEIRSRFLSYFESQGHSVQPSSPLVPGNDPTLLFTNAGMVQFKDVFLGTDPRSYTRAASSQRCVRAGGKHNDLENVGYTARHHTFFEMLGNFSFGDYFKEDAIRFAWEFLTEVLQIPVEKLWVTVYKDDDEAADIWINQIGQPADRLSRLGEKDNFWSMGDTGPCGPCTEIFYDHGEGVEGDPPGGPNDDGDRYIEIWNLVFMQYNRHADGSMEPLPKPSVDTGMGLERIAAVMQGVHNNYDIDLFQGLIDCASKLLNVSDRTHPSLKVIADHIRSVAFLIADGVLPGNEGRGYVLRRIIRRALRHGHKLGAAGTFFSDLVKPLAAEMGQAYPELVEQKEFITTVLQKEEQQFARTLGNGMRILEQSLKEIVGKDIPGEVAFLLYDTYGFPVDLTADIARERGLGIDQEGFESCMEKQRARARKASSFAVDYNDNEKLDCDSEFTGYDSEQGTSEVILLLKGGESAESVSEGDQAVIVLKETPFYGESGGQVGDTGRLSSSKGTFQVEDTQLKDNAVVHIGKVVSGSIKQGDALQAEVDSIRRQAIRLNHSATHLLHAALRNHLGTHVQQKGSQVDSERLRFDFSHNEGLAFDQLQAIEQEVNQQVRANSPVVTELADIETARARGAMMLFGEKYADEVRVLSMGDGYSVELCGGIHAERTGDLGAFKILSESAIASGVRRIEAVTGQAAIDAIQSLALEYQQAAQLVQSRQGELVDRIQAVQQRTKTLENEIKQLKVKLASGGGASQSEVENIGDVQLLVKKIEDVDPKSLRMTLDAVKKPLKKGIVFLASVCGDKVHMVCSVDGEVATKVGANQVLKAVLDPLSGRGGGKPQYAQGGAALSDDLDSTLELIKPLVTEALA